MQASDFEGLFTPFQLGILKLRNRIIFPPMGLQVCDDGAPSEAAIEYYARRATGGASLVMTEGVYIDHHSSGDNPGLGRFYGDQQTTGWRKVADRVHEEGAYTFPELWHVGLVYQAGDVLDGVPKYRPELR